MDKARSGRRSVAGAVAPAPDLVGTLAEAADLSCGIAALDEADLDSDLLPILNRELAVAVTGRCGANALSVRISARMDSVDPAALGADELRCIVRIEKLPDFGPRPGGHSCRPINSLSRAKFLTFFGELFAPGDLGISNHTALRDTAGDLHAGRPVQGRSDYLGRAVFAGTEPIGLFFLAGAGPVREVGFLGAAPGLRRRFGLRGALATGVDWMRDNRISGLTAEIAVQNAASLAMATRLGARTTGLRLVYSIDAAKSP